MKRYCVLLEVVFCVLSRSSGQQLDSVDLEQDDACKSLACPGSTSSHHPFLRCIAKSDEHYLVALSIVESKSQENIVSFDIQQKACETTVNSKARIECQSNKYISEIYAEIQNLTEGEIRNYTCRRTYFDGKIFHKDEQLSLTAENGTTYISEASCIVVASLCLLSGLVIGWMCSRLWTSLLPCCARRTSEWRCRRRGPSEGAASGENVHYVAAPERQHTEVAETTVRLLPSFYSPTPETANTITPSTVQTIARTSMEDIEHIQDECSSSVSSDLQLQEILLQATEDQVNAMQDSPMYLESHTVEHTD